MNREIVENLGLFKLPRNIVTLNKDTSDKTQDNQLMAMAKNFDRPNKRGQDDEEMKEEDKEALAIQKRREKHLMQLDDTKRMYMDQILRKTSYVDDFDFYTEIHGISLEADPGAESQHVGFKDMTPEQIR